MSIQNTAEPELDADTCVSFDVVLRSQFVLTVASECRHAGRIAKSDLRKEWMVRGLVVSMQTPPDADMYISG